DVGKAQEVKRLRLTLTPRLTVTGGEPPELDQPGLVRVQLQPELREPLAKLDPKPPRILLILETNDKVVSEPHNDHVTVRPPLPPPLGPQVEDVVQIQVSQQRGYRCPLRTAFLTCRPRLVLDDSRSQPLVNQPQDPLVRDPVLKKPSKPGLIK